MRTEWSDSNWREEYKAFTSDKKQLKLLDNGPKSLSQSWLLQALYQRWMKIKGYSFLNHLIVNLHLRNLTERSNKQSKFVFRPHFPKVGRFHAVYIVAKGEYSLNKNYNWT